MTLKDEAQLVHAMLNYHAQKGQLAFNGENLLCYRPVMPG